MDVAVIGASGYVGAELTRMLARHPTMDLRIVTSEAHAGTKVGELYPSLGSYVDLVYERLDLARVAESAPLVFLAVPHTAALGIVPHLRARGVTVVDASADFRLSDPSAYERWYGTRHSCPELLREAVYGLPELQREALHAAELIACPGCYPTATILAALPALRARVVSSDRVVVDAISGVSGAGKSLTAQSHFVAVHESVAAYKVAAHRHTPEIVERLSAIASSPLRVAFTPHLAPMSRGLLSTVYLDVGARKERGGLSTCEAVELYREHYRDEPFVTVHDSDVMPSTLEVRGTNRAHLGVAVDQDSGTLIAVCAIDNLVKGASGQAIQCANIALGYDERLGLDGVGLAV